MEKKVKAWNYEKIGRVWIRDAKSIFLRTLSEKVWKHSINCFEAGKNRNIGVLLAKNFRKTALWATVLLLQIHFGLTWKMSLAHFLQRLCWHGRITTGFVNISRHMGQISCFSKLSMLFIFQIIFREGKKKRTKQNKTPPRQHVKKWLKTTNVKMVGSCGKACCSGPGGCSELLSCCCHFCF